MKVALACLCLLFSLHAALQPTSSRISDISVVSGVFAAALPASHFPCMCMGGQGGVPEQSHNDKIYHFAIIKKFSLTHVLTEMCVDW